jgi:hypothetical protein
MKLVLSKLHSVRFIDVYLSIGIAFFVTILPTARAHNSGYVDPNMYIGYATNLNWLISSGGFEYHATRLPLIMLIQFLLNIDINLFGFLYKFFLVLLLSFPTIKIGRIIGVVGSRLYLGALLLALSPLTQSAISWTMPNGFAGIFSVLLLWYGLKEHKTKSSFMVLGFLCTTAFLLNAFGSSIVLIMLAVYQFKTARDIMRLSRDWCYVFLGIMAGGLVYQIYWTMILKYPGIMWESHFRVIFSDEVVTNWQPLSNLWAQGVVSFSLIGIAFLIYFLNLGKFEEKEVKNLLFAGLVGCSYGWLTFILHYNFSFTSFWYFYIYIPLYVISGLFFCKLLEKRFTTVFFFLISGAILYLEYADIFMQKLQTYQPYSQAALYGIVTLILLLSALRKRNGIKTLTNSAVIISSALALLLQFAMPSLLVAYRNTSNQYSIELLKDEILYNKTLATLNPTFGKVATWYEPDPSGYRGSIISSSSFHLLRLEGPTANSNPLRSDYWISKTGKLPECIVMITSKKWTEKGELDNFRKFKLIKVVNLTESSNTIRTYCDKEVRS